MGKNEFERILAYAELLGITVSAGSFSERIKLQKLGYLLGAIVKKTYGDFHFYVRGPYSRSLASDYYSMSLVVKKPGTSEISSDEKKELLRLAPLLSKLSTRELEIIASLLWLKNNEKLDENAAEIRLKEIKSYLDIKDIWRGSQILKAILLKPEEFKRIMESMKDELEMWDKASAKDLEEFTKRKAV